MVTTRMGRGSGRVASGWRSQSVWMVGVASAVLPTVRTLEPGQSLRLTLIIQQPASDCAGLLTALEPAKPCLLTAPQQASLPCPQQASLPGGVYRIERSGLTVSRLNRPIVPAGLLPVATSGTTPTSKGVTLPLDWSSTPAR